MASDCVITDYVTSNLLKEVLLLSSHSVKKKQFAQREKKKKHVMLTRGRTSLSPTTAVCSSTPHYPSNHYRPSYFIPADGRTLKRHSWLQTLNIRQYFAFLNDDGLYVKNISCRLNSSILKLTRGSLFFTKRTIFTDSSSSSSSRSSGRGGSTGSKFFCATVSCTVNTAWLVRERIITTKGDKMTQ